MNTTHVPLVEDYPIKNNTSNTTTRKSCDINTVLMAIIVLLLVAILGFGVYAYRDIRHKTSGITQIVNVLTEPEDHPEAVFAATRFIASAVRDVFFLGSTDGAIANFVSNLFVSDFRALGYAVGNLANGVESVFRAWTRPQECYQPIVCPSHNTYVQCPGSSKPVYCRRQGDVVNCAPASCIGGNIAGVASFIGSIANQTALVRPVFGGNVSDAAFSDGLFRIDTLLQWVSAQTNAWQWREAGSRCRALVNNVQSVTWSGSYRDEDGYTRRWDVNETMSLITNYAIQACRPLEWL